MYTIKQQAKNNGNLIFSEELRRLMKERNLTQMDVAAGVKVTQGAVCGWLKGSVPTGDALHRTALFFGLPMETLLTGKMLAINSADGQDDGRELAIGIPPALDTARVLRLAAQATEALTAIRDELRKAGLG